MVDAPLCHLRRLWLPLLLWESVLNIDLTQDAFWTIVEGNSYLNSPFITLGYTPA